MRIIVTGSRNWKSKKIIKQAIIEHQPTVVVHGDCPTGADSLAETICNELGIDTEKYPADWTLGKRAGPLRNQVMVDKHADVVLAFPHRDSRGTYDCITKAKSAGLIVKEYEE